MRRPPPGRRLVVAIAVVLAALSVSAVALAVTANGPHGLAWAGAPRMFHLPDLPNDRVLMGEVVNRSDHAIFVDARAIVVRDAQGHGLVTAARFLSSFVHPLYAPFQFPGAQDRAGFQRLGVYVRIEPGQHLPLTVSWTLAAGAGPPTRIDLGGATLPLPKE